MKTWSTEEKRYIQAHYPTTSTSEIAKYLSRTMRAVHTKAATMGLRKEHNFLRALNTAISHRRKGAVIATGAQIDYSIPHRSV